MEYMYTVQSISCTSWNSQRVLSESFSNLALGNGHAVKS